MKKAVRQLSLLLFAVLSLPARAEDAALPYSVERLALPGPVAGVAVRVSLADPRVRLRVALADEHDPDGPGPAIGQLDTPSSVARRNGYDITVNAGFFATLGERQAGGKTVRYFVGNGAYPVGWHRSEHALGLPKKDTFRSALLVRKDGRVSIERKVETLPDDCLFAVSGNVMMLEQGRLTPPRRDEARAPRTAVGVSADGKTLWIVVLDGRQEGYSRGVNMAELGRIMLNLGASDGLNLDGGGSTVLVLKDPGTGGYAIANRPSDQSVLAAPMAVERPVLDVLAVTVTPN